MSSEIKSFLVCYSAEGYSMMKQRIIHGLSPVDAARKTYPEKKVAPCYGGEAHYADLILEECVVKNGKPYLVPRKKRCCYKLR